MILFASGKEIVTDRTKKYILRALITMSSSPSSHPFYISMQDIDQKVSCCDVMSVSLKCQPTILHEDNPQNISSDSVKCFRLTILPIIVIRHVLQQFLQQPKVFFLRNPVNFNFCITYGRDCNIPVDNKIKFQKFKSSRLLDRKE
jgi:hypothetical protein